MTPPAPDRRSNLVLRALIDDMLERVRTLARDDKGSERDRVAAAAELESVMSRVRILVANEYRTANDR